VWQKLFDVTEEAAIARFSVKERADPSSVSVNSYQNTCDISQETLISLIISKYFVISDYRHGVIKFFFLRGCYAALIDS
jgi:hypothetical protein